MKKHILITLIAVLATTMTVNAQSLLDEGFESGSFNPLISFETIGSFSSSPGIVSNTNFGSSKAFSFGKSVCAASCFNSYVTTLVINFSVPTLVENISWKEMEIGGNWGSQGQLLLDDGLYASDALGALPVNSGVADVVPRLKSFSINQTVTSIKLRVNDITSASEIILDDLQINYRTATVGILESTFTHHITVYPNPTDGNVTINLPESLSEFIASLYDLNGKLIQQSTYKNTKTFELNLNVQPGIYFLTINSENKKATIRLIRN
ncbi:T9SS type A sorting domain-containing protein [Chryseobacterium suipulveris]|uniref:T9SS type A sorting domain-containing protein n=1 Tax=Chryseobacterium suipulveris TaxID=2929800 RepID=A0ABY4C033_9FLAO|nr:T9SS type A sorting domain-containing protein [Chryseobacterium suipulveris]UOE42115.1 T9SS type A sorting domain-containing protein [Chryseobacterium suipulveris]